MAASPPTLVLISGDEDLLVDRVIAKAMAAARRADPDVERREITAAGLTTGDFAELVAPSLFAEPRLVVVRDTQDASKELAGAVLAYAGAQVEGVTLLVHHSGGARNKPLADGLRKGGAYQASAAKITKPAERLDFVKREIRDAGGATTAEAVAELVDAVGTDLRELATAASQLVADTGGMVDETAVRVYHRGRAEVTGFNIADKVVAGDVAGALEALRWAVGVGYPAVLIADALADGIRTVAKVKDARPGNTYAVASELGMPPWKVDKARATARHWSEAALLRGTAIVAALNADVKGQAVDAEYALERAVLQLSRSARRV